MKYLLAIAAALVLASCSRPEKIYPLESIIKPELIHQDISGLGYIGITGNANGVTGIEEHKFFQKGDRLYDTMTEQLLGYTETDAITVWYEPTISAEQRRSSYNKVYEIVKTIHQLLDDGTFDQFFVMTISMPDKATEIYLNGKGDNAHVGIGYNYSTGKISVNADKGFPELDVLHRLFPTADFGRAPDDAPGKN